MKRIPGGITAPAGFKASGIRCGIKSKGYDLALIYSEREASAAGVFTVNSVQAAPVRLSRWYLRSGRARAVVINSGNANACTGARGYKDAKTVTRLVASELGIKPEDVLTASTGIIGKSLPVGIITKAAGRLVRGLDYEGNTAAAWAIMTTDSFLKEQAVRFRAAGVELTVGAMAKGSGMICPGMATMLCFVTTDARIDNLALKKALGNSVEKTFHRITIDGDRSTNDTVIVLANGLAGNRKIGTGSRAFRDFQRALDHVMGSMARMIVKDGEGATKFIEIEVVGARSEEDAKKIAFSIANSNLVKTALAGESPNWGRIASAAGNAGVDISEGNLSIFIGEEQVMKGAVVNYDVQKVKKSLSADEVRIVVNLGAGKKNCTVWTTDLTEDYVRINREYS